MSDDHPPYNQLYITAWTGLSIVAAVILLGMFFLCNHLLEAGGIVWSLIRWLASPVI